MGGGQINTENLELLGSGRPPTAGKPSKDGGREAPLKKEKCLWPPGTAQTPQIQTLSLSLALNILAHDRYAAVVSCLGAKLHG